MNNKIEKAFNNSKAFIGYITAGQKGIDNSFGSAIALINGGVNILEIGVPFSDPIADGPIIQQASNEAIKNGTTIFNVLTLIKRIKEKKDIPIILFTYLNPLLQAKDKNIYKLLKDNGGDGILLVDLPLEESKEHINECKKNNLSPIFIISPSTSICRIKQINKYGKGFLYYAFRKGTTGFRSSIPSSFAENIKIIKENSSLPIAAGFGISTKKDAEEVLKYADGFVVGSLFVNAIHNGASEEELEELAKSLNPNILS